MKLFKNDLGPEFIYNKNDAEMYYKHCFLNKDEAVLYAKNNKLDFEVLTEERKEISNKSYADNFKFKRIRTDI